MSDRTNKSMATHHLSRRDAMATAAIAAAGLAVAGMPAQAAPQVSSGPPARPANGKGAIVTGSSRGIGAATAKRLAQDGYGVMVNCVVNRELAANVVRDIENAGGRARWIQADVSDAEAVRHLFDAAEEAFGGVDAVVSNAGIMRLGNFGEMSEEDFSRMVDVNQKGSFLVLREAARRVRDGGRIIALSSSITRLRFGTYGPYAATKAAQDIFASTLAKELGGRDISVNAVAPGVVNTTLFTDGKTDDMIEGFAQRTPHRRIGETADIADTIAWLCSQEGAWVNGQTVYANGGLV